MPRKIRSYARECGHTVDRDVPANGLAKRRRIDLGLDIARAHGIHGPLTLAELASWCGCTSQAISLIEQRALRKLRRRISPAMLDDIRDHLRVHLRQSR